MFTAVWAEAALHEVLYGAFTGDMTLEDAYFASLAGSVVLFDDFDIPIPGSTLRGNDIELEIQIVQHFEKQDHQEGTIALVWRSGEIDLGSHVSFNVAFGEGLSYAFSDPDFERGPQGLRGVNSRRFQNYLIFETEWSHRRLNGLHVVGRIHHRSGGYGLINPSGTGSNYLGIGLRYDIK